MESFKLRSLLALGGVLLAVFWALPNFAPVDKIEKWPFKQKLNYGLDIQGGLHLVMGVDVEAVVTESTHRMVNSLKDEFAKDNVNVTDIHVTKPSEGEIQVVAAQAADKEKVQKHISERWGTTLQEVGNDGNTVTLRYYDAHLTDYKSRVIEQAIETIRNRIDEFGVAEPSISKQGDNRILVQLPGMADAERAKQLINTTAKLDFMIVSQEMGSEKLRELIAEAEKKGGYSMTTLKYSDYVTRLNEDLKAQVPAGTLVYFSKAENAKSMEVGSLPYLLETKTNLGGKDLDSAGVSYGEFGEPIVTLRFNGQGGARFADLTGANVNRQMAIVLDKVVKSAPNINERIGGGSATITLGRSGDHQQKIDEAKMISTALRAGALPASLEQLEERRVGPTLGADSIEKAKIGSYIGALIIILFMLIYYRVMGVITTLSLGLNILSILALLTSLGATLTLPGIAGIALTVGFAVDANVLINERIREELAKGGSFKAALQEGYHRAMSAIIDANATTAATAVVLLYFGTGPVRGFAVTLLIGIATTLFANVFVSKVIVDTLIGKFRVQKLSV